MPTAYTTRNRLAKQATGEGTNVWGNILNSGVFDLVDFLADGVATISGSATLTTANGATDQARARILNLTATGATTLTIPSVEKFYVVRSAGTPTITNGSSSVTLYPGEATAVITDGSTIWKLVPNDFPTPTQNRQAATKAYVDAQAFGAVDLPGQGTGIVGFLKTVDGSATWEIVAITDVDGLTAALAAKESTANKAAASDFRSNDADKYLGTNAVWSAAGYVTVTYAASVALDFDTFLNAKITLTGNITFAAPTNLKPGQSGIIKIVQDGTGSRTATFNAAFKFANGIKTLSTTASATDYLSYQIDPDGVVLCALVKAPS